ncbi:hypothetical protein WN943_025086 [Citrus x changshan-huyou]
MFQNWAKLALLALCWLSSPKLWAIGLANWAVRNNTLLHCQKVTSLSSGEKYLKKRVHSFNDSLFQMDDDGLVKLRPFVHTFLEQTSSLFEIYVCTMGTRCYAKEAVKLLDPDSKYFSSRIIGREDFKRKDRKNLNSILGQETGIIIHDDN